MLKLMLALCLMLVMPVSGRGEEPMPGGAAKANPHAAQGNCEVCHVAGEADLNSWFTLSSTKKRMRKDHVSLCQDCHGVEFGHGVGKWPKMNRENLPLDAEGKIACAITCHDMHIKSSDEKQQKFHLRLGSVKLCLSCHNK